MYLQSVLLSDSTGTDFSFDYFLGGLVYIMETCVKRVVFA